MLHDPLADALTNIKNYEKTGKNDCMIKPASNLTKNILLAMQETGYIGSFERMDDGKAGRFKVKLVGKINNCGVIKPRYSVKLSELESWEKKYLPARNFGILLISTPYGVMTHSQAKQKKTGGVLLAYVY
jgi:small subunit ribosomal protein S8